MRHTLPYLLASALLISSSAGCLLYFDDDDDDCLFGGGVVAAEQAADPAPAPGLRNPFTGQCEFFGGGGGCDDPCGPCDAVPVPPPGPQPSWGFCESQCTFLDEATCLASAGCRGVYNETGDLFECWSIDMSGPIQGGSCEGLEAWECSMHEDCSAIHVSSCDGALEPVPPDADIACTFGDFARCVNEPGSIQELCFGEVFCDLPDPGCPPNSIPAREDGCWTGECILAELCEPTALL